MQENYAELEKRVKILEDMLKGFLQSEGNEVHIQLANCQGDLIIGDNCDIKLMNCPVGTIIPNDLENADTLIDDLEGRIDDLESALDSLEDRIDDAEDRVDSLDPSEDE